MTTGKLIINNLRYYWRSHLVLMLAVIISTTVIMGALTVGDSVRFTLKNLVDIRLGKVQFAMLLNGRFFTASLADRLRADINENVAPLLHTPGLAVNPENRRRVNQVTIWAVDAHFWQLNHANQWQPEMAGWQPQAQLGDGKTKKNTQPQLILNDVLANELDLHKGQDVLLRIKKSDFLSGDAPLSDVDHSLALRLPVTQIIDEQQLGHFSLQANQIAPYNIFVDLQWLQQQMEQPDLCNGLLVASASNNLNADSLNRQLKKHIRLADVSLELQPLPNQNIYELKSPRIFLEAPVLAAANLPELKPYGVFSYFVNQLVHKGRTTPYSMVSAIGSLTNQQQNILPTSLAGDDILISDWLADDLAAQENDNIELFYFTIGPKRKLIEQNETFHVKGIFALSNEWADKELMPDFPGLADSENCRDWDPGIPIDLDKIRDKDEAYWDQYRGTPKAFINLETARKLWTNRFGNLTALRYPATNISQAQLQEKILRQLDPAALGLFFQPVRSLALAASNQGMDFGGLFFGLSLFILLAALILVALLFTLAAQQRLEQFATLQALGFSPGKIKRLFLAEAMLGALPAIVLGLITGIIYTRVLILGLLTIWQDAVGSGLIRFHAVPATVAIAAVVTLVTVLLVMILSLRKPLRLAPQRLRATHLSDEPVNLSRKRSIITALLSLISFSAALLLVILFKDKQGMETAGIFFAAGSLLLLACITFCHLVIKRFIARPAELHLSLTRWSLKNTARNPSRSLAVIILLACGTFIVIAVSANRHDPLTNIRQRSSGTGGFALYAESSLPVYQDLNTPQGRDALSLSPDKLHHVYFTPARVRAGDDASCLNLNRAQKPRLLGINPDDLETKEAFSFTGTAENSWSLLNQSLPPNIIPALGDKNTVVWALGQKLNGLVDYTDEQGHAWQLKIVGLIDTSILQGSLIISEKNFIRMFPSEPGYRTFFIDADFDSAEQTRTYLADTLQDIGFNVTLSAHRLLRFNAVQNTYLAIFQLLGGLGLILGTAGFAIVLLRNVLERRRELAMCRAIGYSQTRLQKMILLEHALLLIMGLLAGLLSATLAVYPALAASARQVPVASLIAFTLILAAASLLWLTIATRIATGGSFLKALRTE